MPAAQKIFLWGLGFFVALGGALGAFLFVSLWPYFPIIGKVAAGLLITVLVCAAWLALVKTYSWTGILLSDRRRARNHERLVTYDGGSFYLPPAGIKPEDIYHASALLEQARAPRMIEAAKPEKLEATDETIIELYNDGQTTLETIADSLGLSYYKVQSTIAVAKKKGLIHRR